MSTRSRSLGVPILAVVASLTVAIVPSITLADGSAGEPVARYQAVTADESGQVVDAPAGALVPFGAAPAVIPTALRIETGVIDTSDRGAVARAYHQQYLPSLKVKPHWTGSVHGCHPGTVSAAYRGASLTMVNYFRGLAGLPSVEFDAGLNAKSQAAALMMDAANALSHFPGPHWPCHSAAGVQGASHSNLCLGCIGADAIEVYIADPGSGNEHVGHRQWILYPPQTTMGTGSTGQGDALYVVDDASWVVPDGPPQWVSWPPAGFVPRRHIYSRFSLSKADADFSDATAHVTLGGKALHAKVVARNGYYGDPVVVIAVNLDRLQASNPSKDHVIEVTVRGIKVGSLTVNHTWRTTVFSPK